MYMKKKARKVMSFQKVVQRNISVIIIPLFFVVLLFDFYTIQQQKAMLRFSHQSTLSIYQAQFADVLQLTEDLVVDTAVNNNAFASVVYARTKNEAYLAAQELGSQFKPQLKAHGLISAFCTYSKNMDSYYVNYSGSYHPSDISRIRTAVISAVSGKISNFSWMPLTLANHTVLLYTYVRENTVLAAVIDPSRQGFSKSSQHERIFHVMSDGTPFVPLAAFGAESIPIKKDAESLLFQSKDGKRYDLILLPLPKISGYIVYSAPSIALMRMLTPIQKILLCLTLCLLASVPICWMNLRRYILEPLRALNKTAQKIQEGDTQIHVPQESGILEVNEISSAANTMLDIIRQQKIDFYEQQLETQQAQLQYLHMQTRPHFFLNCLNVVYSMAGEKKYEEIQELILNLSVYLRSSFKNSFRMISLAEEARSVNSYIRIQQIGAALPPHAVFEIESEVSHAAIPPLSILTFVENSIKHSIRTDLPLEIQILCKRLPGEDGDYLNITIRDNSSGFSPDVLKILNQPSRELYQEHQVGISNLKHRLRLLYGEKAALYFRNLTGGACVELFLPLEPLDLRGEQK